MKRPFQQRGLTMAELIIASALALLILSFMFKAMLSSAQLSQHIESTAQSQDNGRFALAWLRNSVRKAGFPNPDQGSRERIDPFAPICTAAPSSARALAQQDCSYNSHLHGGDRLAIRRSFINKPDSKTDRRTCSGTDIIDLVAGAVLTDVYWVNPAEHTLWCATYQEDGNIIGSAAALVSDIEAMHVLYGFSDTYDINGHPTQLMRFTSLTEGSSINKIKALRIALLTRSTASNAAPKTTRHYILLDAAPLTFDDQITRQIQSTTVYLQNQ